MIVLATTVVDELIPTMVMAALVLSFVAVIFFYNFLKTFLGIRL